jgi:DNA repair protein RecO (recombination protein O)
MLHKTKGIVLNYIKHGETSIITHVYTEVFGRQSCIINGVRSSHSKIKLTLFQPLTILDLELYFNPKKDLQRIKEVRNHTPLFNIPNDIYKTSIAIFISEILCKTLYEAESNPSLFSFLYNSVQFLDLLEKNVSNFHLVFLLQLTKHLGIFPQIDLNQFHDVEQVEKKNDDLIDYRFFKNLPVNIKNDFLLIYEKSFQNLDDIKLEKTSRDILMGKLLDFYNIHFENISSIKSLAVLKEVFN